MGALTSPVNDVEGAIARASTLGIVTGYYTPEIFLRHVQQFEPGVSLSNLYLPTSLTIGFGWAIDGVNLLLFLGGCTSQSMGQSIYYGYARHAILRPDLFREEPIRNPFFQEQAVVMADRLLLVPTHRIERVYVAGYSAGGAIAFYLSEQLVTREIAPRPYIITFGSPKPAGPELLTTRAGTDICRWMNSDDPVPFIPPTLTSGQRFWAGLSVYQGERVAQFRQTRGGVSIGLTGHLTTSDYPTGNPIPQHEAVAAWIANQDRPGATAHSLTTYYARLTLARPPVVSAPPVRAVPSGSDQQPVTPLRVIEQAIATEVQTVFADATRQNRQPLVIPSEQLFIVRRGGRIWYVFFGGVVISAGPTKRRARALARVGNDFLRRIQRQGQVATGDFAAMFALYLELASDPTAGFSPVL